MLKPVINNVLFQLKPEMSKPFCLLTQNRKLKTDNQKTEVHHVMHNL
jgi:hypothetical protein